MAAFLKAYRYGGRKPAAQLLARLRSAAAGRTGELETRARRSVVVRLVGTLQRMVTHITELEAEIAAALDAHPNGEIFRSFFRCLRVGAVCRQSPFGDRRLPRALPAPRRDRRRRRSGSSRQRIWQTQAGDVSLGVQQAAAQRNRHARPKLAQMEPVGG